MDVNIYYIPRAWQEQVDSELKRFHTLVVHRRAGKTVYAISKLVRGCLFSKEDRPQFAYIAPTYRQAKSVAWDILKTMLKDLISAGICVVNEAELRIDFVGFPNAPRIRVLGAENKEALRGLYFSGVVLDEVADMDKDVFEGIVRPALADRKGWALFIGTPKGKNYFHELYTRGLSGDKNWGSHLLTWKDTGALDAEELNEIRRSSSEEKFEQEFECSFTAAFKGAYFGKQIDKAEVAKRIGPFNPDPEKAVITAWDIGFDGTAVWFCQLIADEIRIIDFLQVEDADVPEVVQLVKNKPYVYDYHILPHDAAKRSNTNKQKTTKSTIEGYGFKCITAPRTSNLTDDINNARRLLDKCYFNLYNCERGLNLLRLYRSKYDEKSGILLSTPIHDESSHAADAFRTLAAGLAKKNYKADRASPVQMRVRGSYDPLNHTHDVLNNDWDPFVTDPFNTAYRKR